MPIDLDRLPKKRMGSGALFLNEQGQILLVNPTYKPQWEIPGGIVEDNESPREACVREVEEELSLILSEPRLLCLDYTHARPERSESLMFIFWGGVLTAAEIGAIRLPMDELSEYRFVDVEEVSRLLTATLADRVLRSFEVIEQQGALYMES